MTASERITERTIERVAALYVPDERTTCFEVEAHWSGETLVVEGTVMDECLRARTIAAFERIVGNMGVRDTLDTLDGTASPATTTGAVVPVRKMPESESEQVTQILYGEKLTAYDLHEGWRRVRTPGGYLGWIRERHMIACTRDGSQLEDWTDEWTANAVIGATQVGSVGENVPERLFAGTVCRVEGRIDEDLRVSFRTGTRTTLPASAVRSLSSTIGTADPEIGDSVVARESGAAVAMLAKQFLGTPYEWGGMTIDGIDCSGLVWIAYRCLGLDLPRDADQQEGLGVTVERSDLQPGDLLFFPGHVAISLGGDSYVHAYGSENAVGINSLDPSDDAYIADLADSLRARKRLIETE